MEYKRKIVLRTFWVDEEIYEKFKDLCRDNENTPSRFIRVAIKRYLKINKKIK